MNQRRHNSISKAIPSTCAAILFAVALTASAATDISPRWSLPFTPPTIPESDIAIFNPSKTNLGPLANDAVYGGKVYQYLSNSADDKPVHRSATYSIKPATTGRYALFAGVNVQKQNFSSPLQFRLNQQNWQPVPEPVSGTPRWGVSNAMAWTCLGTFDLNTDAATQIEIGGDKPRSMDGRMAIYINGIIGYRVDELRPVQIGAIHVDQNEITIGQSLKVTVDSPKPEDTRGVLVEVRFADSTVVQDCIRLEKSADGKPVASVTLPIPFDVPAGDYTVAVQPLFYQQMTGAQSVPIKIRSSTPDAPRQLNTNSVRQAKLDSGGNLNIQLSSPATSNTVVGVWYFDSRGYLLAAQDEIPAAGKSDIHVTLQSPRWRQRGAGHIEVFVHHSSAQSLRLDLPQNTPAVSSFKPMSHGVYTDESSAFHRWYVTDDHTLVWNGKPWIPFGGMYCDPVLTFYSADNATRQKRWQARHETLDAVQKAGISSLYLNLAHGPLWARQAMVNELTRRNIAFGWQLADAGKPFESYPIRSSVEQGLCIGQVHDGKLDVELPRENITGLLIVNTSDVTQVRTIDAALDFNQPSGSDFIVMEGVKDQKKGFAKVRIDTPDLHPGSYYVLPRILRSGHMINVWEQRQQILASHQWIRDIKWGPNFRFFIDPVVNEGGIYNGDESLRVNSPVFNAEFSQWLATRYKTIRDLELAWRLSSGSLNNFDQAARLIPLRNRANHDSTLLWIDPTQKTTFATAGGLGAGWYDYNDAVRQSYARHRDEISEQIRKWVNVPIVFKRVTPWVCDETINQTVGGMNGIGVDIYPDKGSKLNSGLTSGSLEAQLGAQTIWLMGAELGYNANPGNGNVRGFPSYEYVRDLTRASAAWGLKGFMYFGLRLEPSNLWGNMQLYSLPDQMQWIIDAQKDITQNPPAPAQFAQAYPDGQSWWWRAGGQLLTKYSCVYDAAPSAFQQSMSLIADMDESRSFVAVNASQPMPQAKLLLVNFSDADSVARFGPYVQERIKAGRPVIYIGNWPAGARLPAISEHFTSDGKQFVARPGDQTLATDSDNTFAKRNGKLLIITGEFKLPRTNSRDTIREIKQEWIESLLQQP